MSTDAKKLVEVASVKVALLEIRSVLFSVLIVALLEERLVIVEEAEVVVAKVAVAVVLMLKEPAKVPVIVALVRVALVATKLSVLVVEALVVEARRVANCEVPVAKMF